MKIADTLNGMLRRIPVWIVYLIGLLPIPGFIYLGAVGRLGVEPISALEHELGQMALKFLVLGLAVTPLRRFAGINLIRFRRAFGLIAFTYVAAHLTVWLVLDLQSLERIWADIVKRPYITIGMTGFVLMIPLAITSNNRMTRRLGPKWRQLHKLTYGVVVLGAVHFVMVGKGWQIEPLVYLGVVLVLLCARIVPRKTEQPDKRATGKEAIRG